MVWIVDTLNAKLKSALLLLPRLLAPAARE
jgi:hypothetical protein